MEENKNREGEERSDLNVYEVSFLVLPSVAENGLPELVSSLKASIEDSGGFFISEDFPKLMPLAYTMFVSKDNKKEGYSQAYFGWFKFEIGKDKIGEISKIFDKNGNILRSLVIETVKENTLYSHKLLSKKTKDRPKKSEGISKEAEAGQAEEIDKSIEDLVIN